MKTERNNLYRKILYLRREFIAYYYYFFKPKSPDLVCVIIFGQGRTGSTLLEDLICKSGHFQKNGELFHKSRGPILFPVPFLLGLAKRNPKQHFIFHVKIYQLVRDRKSPVDLSVFLKLLSEAGWKIIYLRRRNKVKHVLSNYVLNARGKGHKYDDSKEELTLYIEPEGFIKWVNQRARFEEEEQKVLTNLEYHEVVYEDDLEKQHKHQETVDKILDYLSLPRKKVTTRHKKVNNRSLNELITNYDQFQKSLKVQGFGNFLD